MRKKFILQYGIEPHNVILSPGRINIIGEHTDYNDGLAIPAAINRWVCTAISKCDKDSFSIFSINYDQSITISSDSKIELPEPWIKLVYTAINILKSEYAVQGGGNIVIGGNIPIGYGLSSSAAFVISITAAFLRLFKIQIKDRALAKLCQKIENTALGFPCGLLDQYGIILAKQDHCLMIDFQDNSVEYLPASLIGCSWVVVNSLIQRELSENAYIHRVKECRNGLEILNKRFRINGFREIDKTMLPELGRAHNVAHKRLHHLLDENSRVKEMKVQLEEGNTIRVGEILQESHESLKTLYEVSCKEIDYIIQHSESFDGWYGGRIIGGGFGGCSLHLIRTNVVKIFSRYICNGFGKEYGFEPNIMRVNFQGGVNYIL